jgi:hypothetical protein
MHAESREAGRRPWFRLEQSTMRVTVITLFAFFSTLPEIGLGLIRIEGSRFVNERGEIAVFGVCVHRGSRRIREGGQMG